MMQKDTRDDGGNDFANFHLRFCLNGVIYAVIPDFSVIHIFAECPMRRFLMSAFRAPGTFAGPQRRKAAALTWSMLLFFGASSPAARADLTITPTFDSSITSDPNAAAIEGTITSAIQEYQNTYSNPINVTIYFSEQAGGLGSSNTVLYDQGYQFFRNGLAANQAISGQADQATALANLPNGVNNPVSGTSDLFIKTADIKALGGPSLQGVQGPDGKFYDGVIGLNTSITNPGSPGSSLTFFLAPVVKHEIDEVLGLGSALPNPVQGIPFAEDLYRYDQNGNRSFTSNGTAQAYFSIDGTTKLAQFDNQNDGGDFGDWQSNPLPQGVPPQVQDAFATPGANPDLGVELTALDVLGYTRVATVPEPSTLAITGLCGVLGFGSHLLRRRRKAD
jgi:hypothetical protein